MCDFIPVDPITLYVWNFSDESQTFNVYEGVKCDHIDPYGSISTRVTIDGINYICYISSKEGQLHTYFGEYGSNHSMWLYKRDDAFANEMIRREIKKHVNEKIDYYKNKIDRLNARYKGYIEYAGC